MDGLTKELKVMTFFPRLLKKVNRRCLTGEEQNLACRTESFYPNCKLHAGHLGHDNIRDEQVWDALRGGLEGIKRVCK